MRKHFVRTYPIKIDGECSFFTFDSTNLSEERYIMVVSKDKLAFIEKKGQFKYLEHTKRTIKTNGYIGHFGKSNYKITLDVNKGKKINDSRTEFNGSLKISNGAKSKTIAVHGINEEYRISNKLK